MTDIIDHLHDKEQYSKVRVGIQGGKGSFNEIAFQDLLKNRSSEFFRTTEVEVVYLYTTEAVLQALSDGAIEYGQFAIANSIGGLVDETMRAIGSKRFHYMAHYEIAIEHALMVHPNAVILSLDTVSAHDQALRQCKNHIAEYYPDFLVVPGTGNLIDNAATAEALSSGTLPLTTAVIGHKSLAEIYGLKILRENMQDRSDNRTTFVLINS